MKLLITGASGRLGQIIRTKLTNRPDLQTTYLISPRSISTSSSEIKLDLTDFRGLDRTVCSLQPDAIIHLAGISGVACDEDRQRSYLVNVAATEVLCEAAAAAGTSRIILASTAAVYGDQRRHAVSEGDVVDLRSTYAESKFRSEGILREWAGAGHLSTIALRIFNIYGENFSNSLVERLLASTPANPTRLQGLDSFVRDYVHGEDVAKAFLLALAFPAQAFSTINIGSGIPISNSRLVHLLESKRSIHYAVGDASHSYSVANIKLAGETLGYMPARTLEGSIPSGCARAQ